MRRNTTNTEIVKAGPGQDIRAYTDQQLKSQAVRAAAEGCTQVAEQLVEELRHPDRRR